MKVRGKSGHLFSLYCTFRLIRKRLWVVSLCRTRPGQLYLAVMEIVLGDQVRERQKPVHVGQMLNFTPEPHEEIKQEPRVESKTFP